MNKKAEWITAVSLTLLSNSLYAGAINAQRGPEVEALYSNESFGFELGQFSVHSNRDYKNARGTNHSPSGDLPAQGESRTSSDVNFSIPYFQAYFNLGERFGCLGRSYVPYYGEIEPGPAWAGRHVRQGMTIDSDGLDLTCRISFRMSDGNLIHLLGGYRQVDMDVKTLSTAPSYVLGTEVDADTHLKTKDPGHGWRAGFAYEIPRYHARVQLIYTSPVDIKVEGDTLYQKDGRTLIVDPRQVLTKTPRAFDLSVQSGIPIFGGLLGWMNLRYEPWQEDWRTLVLTSPITGIEPTRFDWKPGLTVDTGLAKRVTPALTLATSIVWDRSTSQDLGNSYGISFGGSYALTQKITVKASLGTRYLEGSKRVDQDVLTSNVVYDIKPSWNYAYGMGLKIAF